MVSAFISIQSQATKIILLTTESVYIWQRPCLYKCDGGRSVIYKPNMCLL